MILAADSASIDGNPAPDLELAKQASNDGSRLRIVILRGTYGTWVDTTWKRDWAELEKHDLVRGVYLFPRYDQEPEPQVDVFKFVLSKMKKGVDMIPFQDIEGTARAGLSPAKALAWHHRMWVAMKAILGAAPGIYTSRRVVEEELVGWHPDFLESDLWIAKPWPFPVKTEAQRTAQVFATGKWEPYMSPLMGDDKNWELHQYQGDAQHFPGIGQVDISRFQTMRLAATGERVRRLQRRMVTLGGPEMGPLNVSGVFDDDTDKAFRAFQRKHKLDVDGIYGPRSMAAASWIPASC